MSRMSKKDFENYLNDLYSENYTSEEAMEQFCYLGSNSVVRNNYYNNSLGTLLRKNDQTAFEVAYNDYING